MKTKRKSKSKKWIVISIITIVVVALAGSVFLRPKATNYDSVNATVGHITTYYSFSGNIETKNRQTVMSENIMQVSDINVKEGETVKKDEVLFTTTSGVEIKSEISGEIVNIFVEENAQVMAGAQLLEIVDYNNLEVNVKVDEYDISALKKGKETTIKVGAIDKELKGKINSISKEGQILNGVTFFIATIDLHKDDRLKIGMSAEVKLISKKATGVVKLPMTAISFDENNIPYVLKKDAKGAIVTSKITTGINDGTNVEVKNGVIKGETILYKKVVAASGMVFGRGRDNASPDDDGGDD